MARGSSGRIVIEIDPALKRTLYIALASEGITLKNWFIDEVARFVSERQQPTLPGMDPAKINKDRRNQV